MPNWPATLPQDLLAGASIGDDESRLTTNMDAGPASVRNRFTAITQSVKGGLILTGTELETFNTFLRTTLQHGSLAFDWTDPSTGDSVSMRFKKKPQWACIKPAAAAADRYWTAEIELEILP
jgi:hypothetical protein